MGELHTKPPGDFLLDLITSDMNLARAFIAVSRSAYRLGNTAEGDFARLKAVQLYSEAAQLVSQLGDALQEELTPELQALSTAISWLFMPPAQADERSPADGQLLTFGNGQELAQGD